MIGHVPSLIAVLDFELIKIREQEYSFLLVSFNMT